MGGLILGRSPVLWYGFLVALLNLAELVGVITLPADAVAGADTVFALGLALLANSSDPRAVPTFAASITPPTMPTAPTPSTPTPTPTSPDPSAIGSSSGAGSSAIGGATTSGPGPSGGG